MPEAIADVLTHLSVLPPFPKVTTRLLEMVDDEAVSVEDLASVVSADPSLVAKVIHVANSPFYMLSQPVESVRDAVFVLGISAIKNITVALSIQKGLVNVKPRADVFSMLDFWKHSYATAIVASKLGARHDRKTGDTMYLTGLVHDMGKVILGYYWPDLWNAVSTAQANTKEPYHRVEERLCPHTHAHVAAELFRSWKFPTKIITIVAGHHQQEVPEEYSEGARALRIADTLVNASGYAFPAGNVPEESTQVKIEYGSLVENLPKELEYQLKVLNG